MLNSSISRTRACNMPGVRSLKFILTVAHEGLIRGYLIIMFEDELSAVNVPSGGP